MTTLTATPDTATGSVQISITQTSSVTKVVRSDGNGISEVRVAAGQLPSAATGTTVISDYEAANGLNTYNIYTATDVRTNLATNPSVEALGSDVTIRTNLISNPSFETGTTGLFKAAAITLSTTTYAPTIVSGTQALQIDIGASAGTFTYVYQSVNVVVGEYLAFGAHLRWSAGSRYARQRITFKDSGGVTVGTSVDSSIWLASSGTGGDRHILSGLTPTGAVTAQLLLYFYNDAAGAVAPIDTSAFSTDAWMAVSSTSQPFAEEQVTTWFDGSTAAAGDYTYAWTGTAHASTSIQKGKSATGYLGLYGTGGLGVTYRTTDTPYQGSYAGRALWTKDSMGGSAGAVYTHTVSGVAGDVRSLRARVRTSTAKNLSMLFRFRNVSTVVGTAQTAYAVTVANGWTEYVVDNVVATGAYTNIQVYPLISNTQQNLAGDTLDMDAVLIEAGAAAGPYFDGASASITGVVHAWTGTANASTSTQTTSNPMFTASATLTIAKPWLMVPIAPNFSETVEAVTNYSGGRTSRSTVHQIIGRADPLVVLGKLGTRTGTLEIWTDSIVSANKLARVFDRGEIVMLKQPVSGIDMYFTAEDLDISPFNVEGPDLTRYKFTVRYQEVVRPYGNLAGALGWTFDALASRYSTFDQILTDYATFDALTLGGK